MLNDTDFNATDLNDTDFNVPDLSDAVPSELASIFAAAAAPPVASELRGEQATVAAFLAGRATEAPKPGRVRSIRLSKATLAAVAAVSLVGISGAAAATGSLPDRAQDVARTSLTKVGINVPKGNRPPTAADQLKKDFVEPAKEQGPRPDKPSLPVDKPSLPVDKPSVPVDKPSVPVEKPSPPSTTKGAAASSVAKDPALVGADKGAAVSDTASEGKSRAGDDGSATTKPGSAEPTDPGKQP